MYLISGFFISDGVSGSGFDGMIPRRTGLWPGLSTNLPSGCRHIWYMIDYTHIWESYWGWVKALGLIVILTFFFFLDALVVKYSLYGCSLPARATGYVGSPGPLGISYRCSVAFSRTLGVIANYLSSADATIAAQATGAMSWAFVTALKKNPQQSYVQLLNSIRDELATRYTQKPQLSCSHPLSMSKLSTPPGVALLTCDRHQPPIRHVDFIASPAERAHLGYSDSPACICVRFFFNVWLLLTFSALLGAWMVATVISFGQLWAGKRAWGTFRGAHIVHTFWSNTSAGGKYDSSRTGTSTVSPSFFASLLGGVPSSFCLITTIFMTRGDFMVS